ncbi:sulfite exporter TauE/SafE family protein [Sedimentisphaera salicampi]|uniref:Probable membrane transporter protein n=1 Tax=Sedimentisphaera salicampi TaxID=1941349 RepID=A0A1W6LKU5_9BACT|nr:sulfite exporter TauE/SafE family protein [Sedimentisphaera salicampi]ARN56362.1 Sulfite exporter TauE/SafE [Sedimentisphaera salicampi]OXU15248.1 Sulfite exporter TauE/SafE [Sedimentisphaera salicampi]
MQSFGLIIIAFFCEFVDATLGMGYGTTLTPVLMLLFGFEPLEIVPAVLLSELVSGLLAAVLHHFHGNVNLRPETMNARKIAEQLSSIGYIESFKQNTPRHLKIAILLSLCSVVGTVAAIYVAVNIPEFWLKLYIGVLVFSMGLLIMICLKKTFRFSWHKMTFLGVLASFNKGISGGGYGPVVTSGQILSGVNSKSAVGITSLAEGLTCLVGVVLYVYVLKQPFDFRLAPWLCTGAVLSVPLSALAVKKVSSGNMKMLIAVITMALGLFTLLKLFF